MGKLFVSPLLWLLPLCIWGQQSSIDILPELGLAVPHGDFSAQNVFAKNGYQAGIHIDKKLKSFGLGLYLGFNLHKIRNEYPFPSNNTGLSIEKIQSISLNRWQQWKAGLGPSLSFDLSNKIKLDLGTKLGFSKINYPNFIQSFKLNQPLSSPVYTLYQTLHADLDPKLNPMAFSFLRLNVKASEKLGVFVSGNYTHVRNVAHAYRYLDGDFSADMSSEAFLLSLRTAPTVMEIRKCHFNTAGITLGLSLNIGGGKAPKTAKKPQDSTKTALSVQYYQLLNSNSGNYVEIRNQLRTNIPHHMQAGMKTKSRIYNAAKQEVFNADNLLPGAKGKNYSVDQFSRMTIDISQLKPGYYVFELQNEQGRTYFFRFKIAANGLPGKK